MTLTNRDASTITLKKKQKALYAWKSGNDALLVVGRSVLREQATMPTLDVVTDRKQGGCKCSDDASSNPYANLR